VIVGVGVNCVCIKVELVYVHIPYPLANPPVHGHWTLTVLRYALRHPPYPRGRVFADFHTFSILEDFLIFNYFTKYCLFRIEIIKMYTFFTLNRNGNLTFHHFLFKKFTEIKKVHCLTLTSMDVL
jgi:hypothetical protein